MKIKQNMKGSSNMITLCDECGKRKEGVDITDFKLKDDYVDHLWNYGRWPSSIDCDSCAIGKLRIFTELSQDRN